jgi:hypothetical protein
MWCQRLVCKLQDLAATNWLGAAALAFLLHRCAGFVVAVGLTLYNKQVSACLPLGECGGRCGGAW